MRVPVRGVGGNVPRVRGNSHGLRGIQAAPGTGQVQAPPRGWGMRGEQEGRGCQEIRGTPLPGVGRREEEFSPLELLFGVWFYNYNFLGVLRPLVWFE